jgi:hypothetical protein
MEKNLQLLSLPAPDKQATNLFIAFQWWRISVAILARLMLTMKEG